MILYTKCIQLVGYQATVLTSASPYDNPQWLINNCQFAIKCMPFLFVVSRAQITCSASVKAPGKLDVEDPTFLVNVLKHYQAMRPAREVGPGPIDQNYLPHLPAKCDRPETPFRHNCTEDQGTRTNLPLMKAPAKNQIRTLQKHHHILTPVDHV